jgi:hypothetical protein
MLPPQLRQAVGVIRTNSRRITRRITVSRAQAAGAVRLQGLTCGEVCGGGSVGKA